MGHLWKILRYLIVLTGRQYGRQQARKWLREYGKNAVFAIEKMMQDESLPSEFRHGLGLETIKFIERYEEKKNG